jgi:hypothetical protein
MLLLFTYLRRCIFYAFTKHTKAEFRRCQFQLDNKKRLVFSQGKMLAGNFTP